MDLCLREKGKMEARRLKQVYESLKQRGYDRRYGRVQFLVLKRGRDYRFLNAASGHHRTAAMSALGHNAVPGVFWRPHVVDIDMARYWPQVQLGLWTEEEAVAYLNHLFDFDSKAWARRRGSLTSCQEHAE